MPFQKLQFRPGIVRDTTALAAEGGWYEGNNIRFRMGFPEKIGGWQRISANVFQGTCRTLSAWETLTGQTLYGIGTNLKMYVAMGGSYYDVTPLRTTLVAAANAFTTINLSNIVTANVGAAHGALINDFVTLSGNVSAVGGLTATQLTGNVQVLSVPTASSFTFAAPASATSGATGGNSTFAFELGAGPALDFGSSGWGAGVWGGSGGLGWGYGTGITPMRVWNHVPYGEQLIYGQRGGPAYQFLPVLSGLTFSRGTPLTSLVGASGTPLFQNIMFFSPAARILVFCGTNSTLNTNFDPLLVRWADSDSLTIWNPLITNLAGEYRLPRGSQIVATASARQDQVILTDTACYIMQFIGAPLVFSFTQQSDNISVIGPRAAASAAGAVFWMGMDKFYVYDGKVSPLDCPLKNEIFNNINQAQYSQAFAGTSEGFDEVWWFYCSASSSVPDKYVIFNYVTKVWYYGAMTRTAWLDSPLSYGPLAAMAFGVIVAHETGVDDLSTATTLPISAYIKSADFDIGDGQNYAFVRKFLPDVNFAGSVSGSPTVYMTLQGRKNPGGNAGSTPPQAVALTATSPNIRFTDEVSVRLRARQMNVKLESTDIGVKWQFGTPRIEVRPDGRAA